jgi:hypothetical protein
VTGGKKHTKYVGTYETEIDGKYKLYKDVVGSLYFKISVPL